MHAITKQAPALAPLFIGVWLTAGAVYLAGRTVRVAITLAPEVLRQLKANAKIAGGIYAGNNIRIVHLDETPDQTVNRYHTRYEGTERAATGEEA